MKTKYYRTYITVFETSVGMRYYAGMHTSRYENSQDDPYFGSGNIIKHAVEKYGRDCIRSIEWFDHSSEEDMRVAEVQLISEVKLEYGDLCVNYGKGGVGGDTMRYATEIEKQQYSLKMSSAILERNSRYTEEERTIIYGNISIGKKSDWDSRDEEYRREFGNKIRSSLNARSDEEKAMAAAIQSTVQKEAWSLVSESERKVRGEKISNGWANRTDQQKSEYADKVRKNNAIMRSNKTEEEMLEWKRKQSESIRIAMRKSPVWKNPLYWSLWLLWCETGGVKFHKRCKSDGLTDLCVGSIGKHFKRVVDGEESLMYNGPDA